MIYPCIDQVKLEQYKKMIESSKEIFEYFHSGKRNPERHGFRTGKEQSNQQETSN